MMRILVINKFIKAGTFLKSQFEISDYTRLYISKLTLYQTLIKNLSEFDIENILFTDNSLDSYTAFSNFLDKQGLNINELDEEIEFIYYDLSLFPRNFKILNNIFAKLSYAEDKVLFYEINAEKQKNYLPILKFKVKDLKGNINNESSFFTNRNHSLEIDLSNLFLDLSNASDVLELFSSNIEQRYFNEISATTANEFFLKTSSNKKKIIAEYNFLRQVPESQRPYYPQVGKLTEDQDTASYQVEKIYMFDLSKLLINGVLNRKEILDNLLRKIQEYLATCPSKKINIEQYRDILHKSFIVKNEERFVQTQALDIYPKLEQIAIFSGYQSVKAIHEEIIAEINKFIAKCKDTTLYFSHGDLCFSNILFDKHTYAMKLIDPRGSSSNLDDSYRPIYYDLAKLSHSFVGLYDLIIYDLLDLKISENGEFCTEYMIDPNYAELLSNSFSAFLETLGYDLATVRLFETSLFISMIPLHQENPKKVFAQLIQAVKSLQAYKALARK